MDDNVTQRKPYQSSSLTDLTANSSALFDTTMMSLPNTSLNNSQTILDLQDKIKVLYNDLQSAHHEIENLNSENFRLKTDIQKYIMVIDTYKKISMIDIDKRNSTPKSGHKRKSITNINHETPATNKQQQIAKMILNPQENIETLEDNTRSQCNSSQCKEINTGLISTTPINNYEKIVVPIISQPEERFLPIKLNTSKPATTVIKKKILILADQQGFKLQRILQKLIGEEFVVTCFWKSGAQLCEVLSSAEIEISNLQRNDYLIIAGGINDKNPVVPLYRMRKLLTDTRNINIIVSEVPYNKYLNIRKLNYELKFTCSNFCNANFVDMNYSTFIPRHTYFALHLSRSLLREALRIEYKLKHDLYCQNISQNLEIKLPTISDKSTQTEIGLTVDGSTSPIKEPNDFFRLQ